MSFIGENIRKLRQVNKLSQAAFAEKLNLARPSVGAYEEGRSEPKIDTLIEISRIFKISVDTLLQKKLTVDDIINISGFNKKLDAAHNKRHNKDQTTVKIIRSNKYSEYVIGRNNRDFLNNLEEVQLPAIFSTRSNVRLFQVNTDKMHYMSEGILPGD